VRGKGDVRSQLGRIGEYKGQGWGGGIRGKGGGAGRTGPVETGAHGEDRSSRVRN